MDPFFNVIISALAFFAIYAQVFFLITFFEKKRHIVWNPADLELSNYPTVTIAVPCYNEEKTLPKTVKSLLSLDYPKDKLSIFLVDDGSKDNTWEVIKSFESYPNIRIFKKENGGKHTALNLALENNTSEFFACLDSDSFVHDQSLKRILKTFERDPRNMAVIPSTIIYNPQNIVQTVQRVEYEVNVFAKKMLGFVGGIQTTPGPLSTFRTKVFDELGHYHKAHNTEDQEMALRMQEHGYRIDCCHDAYIYTSAPDTLVKLYRQRVRWSYGYIKNLVDYKHLLFNKKYGTIAIFTLPMGLISMFGFIFLFSNIIYNFIKFIYFKIIQIQSVGFSNVFNFNFKFDWFFIDVKAILFFSIILYIIAVAGAFIGKKMAEDNSKFSFSIFYFVLVYSIITPFWMLKALYNAIMSKESSWTFERRATK